MCIRDRSVIDQLNSTYLQQLKEESEQYAWFKGGGGDC